MMLQTVYSLSLDEAQNAARKIERMLAEALSVPFPRNRVVEGKGEGNRGKEMEKPKMEALTI